MVVHAGSAAWATLGQGQRHQPYGREACEADWLASRAQTPVRYHELAEKRRHHLTREAAQGGGPARAVDQHIFCANVT